jgi:4-hydroxybenzoate polyprenyltransferase
MFDGLLEALKAYGLPGLAIAAVILVGVFLARRAGLVVNGDIARVANIVLGAILAGLSNDPEVQKALLAALSSVLAGLAYELLKWIGSHIPALSKG